MFKGCFLRNVLFGFSHSLHFQDNLKLKMYSRLVLFGNISEARFKRRTFHVPNTNTY